MPTTNDILHATLAVDHLEDGDRAALAALPVREIHLRRDSMMHADPDWIPVLLEGWACRVKILADGRRQICYLHVAGEMLGLRRLANPAEELEHVALSSCRIGLVSLPALQQLCRRSAPVANQVWRAMAGEAAIAEEWIANIGGRRAFNRVAHLFCELASRMDRASAGPPPPSYPMPLTQADLGDALGISTVHVNRVLQELRGMQLLVLAGGHLVIPDRKRLADAAGFDPQYLQFGAEKVASY